MELHNVTEYSLRGCKKCGKNRLEGCRIIGGDMKEVDESIVTKLHFQVEHQPKVVSVVNGRKQIRGDAWGIVSEDYEIWAPNYRVHYVEIFGSGKKKS